MTNVERNASNEIDISIAKNNTFEETNMTTDICSYFPHNARVTRSSLTKIQPLPSQKNEKEISSSYNKSIDKNVDQNEFKPDQSDFINISQMNTEGKSMYSLVALQVNPFAEMNDQSVFASGNGDSFTQSQNDTRSPVNNISMANLAPSFNDMNMDKSYSNSSLQFYHTIPPPMFIDTSRPPPPKMCSYSYPKENSFRAVVENAGFISLGMKHGVTLDISANKAIRLRNYYQGSNIALSSCGTQLALVHPKGRLLQYGSRIEIQAEDEVSAKNAKMYPKGISFTANNCALVYLVDEAGARSTTDQFHDLFAGEIVDKLFEESCKKAGATAYSLSLKQLDYSQYWKSDEGLDCWLINEISIKQTKDGLVIVERQNGLEKFVFKTSPSNGKVRLESSFVHVTASLGEESHMFVKSGNHRLHYNGQTNMFIVRNAGNAAGFDETGMLRLL